MRWPSRLRAAPPAARGRRIFAPARAGEYRADTLATEGFIHCSEAHQVAEVANVRFREREDLVLLWIDPARVRAEIKYEDASDASGKFPHIHGPLNTDAVARVTDY